MSLFSCTSPNHTSSPPTRLVGWSRKETGNEPEMGVSTEPSDTSASEGPFDTAPWPSGCRLYVSTVLFAQTKTLETKGLLFKRPAAALVDCPVLHPRLTGPASRAHTSIRVLQAPEQTAASCGKLWQRPLPKGSYKFSSLGKCFVGVAWAQLSNWFQWQSHPKRLATRDKKDQLPVWVDQLRLTVLR